MPLSERSRGRLAAVRSQLICLLRVGVARALPAPLCLLACTTRAVGCAASGIRDSVCISLKQSRPVRSCADLIRNSSLQYKIIRVCQVGPWQGCSGCACVPRLDRLL